MVHKVTSLLNIFHLLSELVVYDSYNFEEFLKKLMKVLTKIVPVDSCLIYFYDHHDKKLILIGSKQAHKKLLGKLTMKKGEGITGWVAQHKKTVALSKQAYRDTRFKYFKELPEDLFEAFLSVPIIDRTGVVGVVNFQHSKPHLFTKEQVQTVEAIVKMIASAFENTILQRRVSHLEHKLEERKIVEQAKGLLMKAQEISEDTAYQKIRTEAMKKRKSIREIAEAVLLIYS